MKVTLTAWGIIIFCYGIYNFFFETSSQAIFIGGASLFLGLIFFMAGITTPKATNTEDKE